MAMVYQVIQAGWVYEIEAPGGWRLEGSNGDACLRYDPAPASSTSHLLVPRAVVRAAKDHLYGMSCSRAWPVGADHGSQIPASAILEVG
jgi:hypothetical protein